MNANNPDPSQEAPEPVALVRLRKAIQSRRDLPSRGFAGRQIATLVTDPGIRTRDLVDVALADPSVVTRLVRMANGSTYQTRDRSEVSSIQRAIELIGQTQVRSYVLSLPELDEVIPKDRLNIALDEIACMTFCARLSRNFLDTRNPLVSDEGAVTTLLASLWSTISVLHFPHEVAAMRYVRQHAPKLVEYAHRELFGISPILLNKEIIEAWGLPLSCHETIVHTEQRPIPVIGGRDWLPLAVGISLRVGQAVKQPTAALRDQHLRDIVFRYRRCVDFDQRNLTELVEECAYEAISMERSSDVPKSKAFVSDFLQPFLKREESGDSGWEHFARMDTTGLIARTRAKQLRQSVSLGRSDIDVVTRSAAGKPADSVEQIQSWEKHLGYACGEFAVAQRQILHGDNRIIEEDGMSPAGNISERFLPSVLAAIHSSFGFDRVVWFKRAGQADLFEMAASVGSGDMQIGSESYMNLRCDGLFLAALINNADVHISDCSIPKLRSSLPDWLEQLLPNTRSFLLLPVSGPRMAMGFLLAARSCTDPDGMDDQELSSIIAIRNQLADLFKEFCAENAEEIG